MTESEQEGALSTDETTELVVPEVLEEEIEDQPLSVAEAGITEARLIEILAERDEKTARAARAAKDSAISRNAKDIADILERFEASGSDKAAFIAETDQQAAIDAQAEWQAGIDSRLSQLAAPTRQDWQAEWDVDSQKILDAAEAEDDTVLTTEEYNAAFFGQKFASRGDAYVALNAAISAKRSGKPAIIPAAAVQTEGGEVARTPEPTIPKKFRQKFDSALENGDDDAARKILDARWDEIDKAERLERARQELANQGLSVEELTE